MDTSPKPFEYSQLMNAGKVFYEQNLDVFKIAAELVKTHPKVEFYLKTMQDFLVLLDSGKADPEKVKITFGFFKHVLLRPNLNFEPGYNSTVDVTIDQIKAQMARPS